MNVAGSHLSWLESEAIQILREAVAEAYATFAAGPCTLLRNLGVA